VRLARDGFAHVPRLAGALTYRSRTGRSPAAIVMLQAFVPNDGNGWEEARAQVSAFFDVAATAIRAGEAPPSVASRQLVPYLASAELLGRRTAELHVALARQTDEAFAPEPLTDEERVTLATSMRQRADQVRTIVDQHRTAWPAEPARLGDDLLDAWTAILRPIEALAVTPVSVSKIRVHGDYHLGQVLRAGGDYVIVDFEGEPMRSLDERRQKQVALKDVAGMLRSLSYAVYGDLERAARDRGTDAARLEPWAWRWQRWTSAAFLDRYRRAAGAGAFLPADDATIHLMLDAFLVERALYEVEYELNSRPDWLSVPLWGLWRMSSPRESP
jgi:trehalose synthase-fused probable maltokinase